MLSIKQAKFFVPFLYFTQTRTRSFSKLLSWGIIYIAPTAYLAVHYALPAFPLPAALFCYLLMAAAIYNFYELGYIENDAETIKKETNPTMRLDAESLAFYESNKTLVYCLRYLTGLALFFLLWYFFPPAAPGVMWFSLAVISILLCYLVYNRIRNRVNALLHFMLVSVRFTAYPLIFLGADWFTYPEFWITLFIFPFPNFIEKIAQKRFGFGKVQFIMANNKNLHLFRMIYYWVLALLILFLCLHGDYIWILYLSLYFAVYRTLIVIKGDK